MIPLLPKNRIVLIRQKRLSVRKSLWEIPAGTLEKGENPRLCARRELIEEIGYRANSLKKLAVFYTAPGFCTERMHLYLARDLTRVAPCLEADEEIRPKIFTLQEAKRMVRQGIIQDAKTIVALSFL